MRRALILVLAAAVALAGGCGGQSTREDVAEYIQLVNREERAVAPQFERANRAYERFAKGELEGAEAVSELERTEAAIRTGARRTAALPAPSQAAVLRRRVLAVYDGNAGLAREVTQLAAYTPAARKALKPLDRVNRRLLRDLRGRDDSAVQEQAMRRYGRALRSIVRDLRALDPPPVLESPHKMQIERLDSTGRLAGRLAQALADEDPKAVARRLIAFRRAARTTRGDSKAQRRALRAYDRRTQALHRAYAALQREHARLNGTLD